MDGVSKEDVEWQLQVCSSLCVIPVRGRCSRGRLADRRNEQACLCFVMATRRCTFVFLLCVLQMLFALIMNVCAVSVSTELCSDVVSVKVAYNS